MKLTLKLNPIRDIDFNEQFENFLRSDFRVQDKKRFLVFWDTFSVTGWNIIWRGWLAGESFKLSLNNGYSLHTIHVEFQY